MAKGSAGKGPTVGYGLKGNAFHNVKNYNQSKSGQEHAKNPNLSVKPVGYGAKGNAFFSKTNYAASPKGKLSGAGGPAKLPMNPSAGQVAHFAHAEVSKATPVPKSAGAVSPVMRARGVK